MASDTDEHNTGAADEAVPVRFDTKIAVVVRQDLRVWQKLNATAFLASGVASVSDTLGEPYGDASGNAYLPMFRQPVLVFAGTGEQVAAAYDRAMERGVKLAIFTEELFATGHDAANRAAVRAVGREDLRVVAIAFRAERKIADKVTKGLALHR